jgi:predicted transcriptional regulator
MEVHFPPELESKFSRIPAQRGRNTESLVFEAVERLVGQIASHDEWFLGEVEKGIAAADRGEFIEHADVRTLIDTRYPVSQRSWSYGDAKRQSLRDHSSAAAVDGARRPGSQKHHLPSREKRVG